jgi:hypothetical protein
MADKEFAQIHNPYHGVTNAGMYSCEVHFVTIYEWISSFCEFAISGRGYHGLDQKNYSISIAAL